MYMQKYWVQSVFVLFISEETESGFITFRAFNSDQAAVAMCSGVKPTECNPQNVSYAFVGISGFWSKQIINILEVSDWYKCVLQYCIGGGGFFPERQQCGDFTALDQASKHLTQSAVLLFYR